MKRAGFVGVVTAAVVMMVAGAGWGQTGAKAGTDEWYKWSALGRAEATGYFHVVKAASGEKEAPVVFTHEFVAKLQGKRMSLKMQTWCRNDEWFTPMRIVSEGQGSDEFNTFEARINWPAGEGAGRLTARVNTRKEVAVQVLGGMVKRIEMEIPPRTATSFSVFEIVKGRPFDKEKVFEFNSLEAEELNLKKDHKLTYVGPEELEIGGEKVKLHKFEETGGGIRPTQYWVNEAHQLVRVVMDEEKEFLLTTEEKAKAGVQ